ncbi:MAG: hypothetical protein AAF958_04720 [Planctomycetota bacterium]
MPKPIVLQAIEADDQEANDQEADQEAKLDVSKAEAEVFGNDLAKAIRENDIAAFKTLMDFDKILNRSLEGFEITKKSREDFLRGAKPAPGNFAGLLHKQSLEGGSYDLVKPIRRGKHRHVMMRLLHPTGGYNYHDIRLVKVDGVVRGDQLFFASTGEAFSDTLRGLVAASIRSSDSIIGRMSGESERALARLERQNAVQKAINAGDTATALEKIEALPEAEKRTKLMLLARLQATPLENEAAYLAAVDDLMSAFPGDAVSGLVAMDAGILRNDDALVVRSFENIRSWTGGDPLLNLMVAAVRAENGLHDEALAMIENVDVEKIGLPDAHQYRMSVAISRENYDEVLTQLRMLRNRFGYQFGDLTAEPEFSGFVKSPQYQTWIGQ